MAYSEELAKRIRKAVEHLSVKEKKMFGSLAFLINGKMCLTAGPEKMMCRIDPKLYDEEVKKKDYTTVVMKGKEYKGSIHIKEENLKSKSELDYWIKLALDFNQQLTSKRNKANTMISTISKK